jgi:hypothetical protein
MAGLSSPLLASAIVVFLRVVGCYFIDARMLRWPLPFNGHRCYTDSRDTTDTAPGEGTMPLFGAARC